MNIYCYIKPCNVRVIETNSVKMSVMWQMRIGLISIFSLSFVLLLNEWVYQSINQISLLLFVTKITFWVKTIHFKLLVEFVLLSHVTKVRLSLGISKKTLEFPKRHILYGCTVGHNTDRIVCDRL